MTANSNSRVTVPAILARKGNQKIAALTAYDYTMARLIDQAGIDIILVGDSVASVIQGETNTIPVTLDEMIYHCKCVTRGVEHALVVGDLPFLSYQVSPEQALQSAGRMIKEGRVSAVKLEGGLAVSEQIKKITSVDIPVMGHVGLTPQSYHRMGGHKIQGRSTSLGKNLKSGSRERIIADAVAVEEAGAFAIVLEGIPAEVASEITAKLSIPTIGIGAGVKCDGQILVAHDMLGLETRFKPRFVKRFAELGLKINEAVKNYTQEVQASEFPGEEHTPRTVNLKAVSGEK